MTWIVLHKYHPCKLVQTADIPSGTLFPSEQPTEFQERIDAQQAIWRTHAFQKALLGYNLSGYSIIKG